ncbi:hypothetical protein [Mumia zhuanghuii]|uniref:DNA-directed RNA polymerase subunit beta n=1 Tax=Mumia zhuanghuii TaxID=2585211 RepID=A0A5C4MCB0_9ACTN|nr:hypothetical protein [Mumia zhuanghuii]TNC30536.1 hypothetical protein FHE65_32760 [Mumia zhuanghuii]TNC45021.1 hypothetical protein FHE65_15630 [Mumia zhuanghuii]
MAEFKKPLLSGPELFEAHQGIEDPVARAEAGARMAHLLVRGARSAGDRETTERVLALADEHGLDLLAEMWSGAPADSLAGALWRLYVLRTWVRRDPVCAAREFEAGKAHSPVDEVVAGVEDPPGPQEVVALVDAVVRGVVTNDLADTLDRAAAFARLVGIGRASLEAADQDDAISASRLVDTARALQLAAAHERRGDLS